MFFASLVWAGIQLVGAAGVFAIANTRTAWRGIVATLAGLIGVGLLAQNEALLLQAVVLAAIGIACTLAKARQGVFAGWAIAATAAVLSLTGGAGVCSWRGLKERYPFESMSPRLTYEKKQIRPDGLNSPILTAATRDRLRNAEEWSSWSSRSRALGLVHASYVEQFVASPGFGVGRMIRLRPYHIESGDKRASTLFTLDPRPDPDGSADAGTENLAPESELPSPTFRGFLDTLHDEARRDFLDPNGFGYFRDRDHVAGFVPHGFLNYQPRLFVGRPRRRWLTARVELVSMLKHDRPMVYASDRLPNMTALRDAPVRELDVFEQTSLNSLLAGEDLVSDFHPGRVRAVGSLRATRQCLDCHQVVRGTLLGAFSYEFLRDPPAARKSVPDGDEKLL
jgi:hypothetical protein